MSPAPSVSVSAASSPEKGLGVSSRFFFVLAAGAVVYVISQWNAITNEYCVMDDVRQQVYWMQRWIDPGLYDNDLLSRYAQNYVPWGVQAVYFLGSFLMNPVQFTKVTAFFLYLATIGFIYGLARRFRDDFTAVTIVCVAFFFPGYLQKISGGLSQGFAYPLLAAHLYCLSKDQMGWAAVVLFLQSWFNPYIFTLSLVTHSFFVLQGQLVPWVFERRFRWRWDWKELARVLGKNIPVVLGIMVMLLKYAVMASPEFGDIVTWKDMEGNAEYSEQGRTDDLPPPSLLWELLVPWSYFFPFHSDYPMIFTGCVGIVVACVALALLRAKDIVEFRGFRVFWYLLPASFLLYGISHLLLLRLFIPNRYVELSLTLFYTVALGVAISGVLRLRGAVRWASPLLLMVIAVIGGLRNHNVSIYDYSHCEPVYRFIETLPKESLLAGHPEFMDNAQTFGRRKAFATYELSHPYRRAYWAVMKKRLYDLFDAYYAADHKALREFSDYYGIDYLIVRESDFSDSALVAGSIYFEPFGTYVQRKLTKADGFAALDEADFEIVYRGQGVRILKMRSRSEPSGRDSPSSIPHRTHRKNQSDQHKA